MTAEEQLSGVDLARVALLVARNAAKERGDTPAAKPKKKRGTRPPRGDDPAPFGAAITSLMTERGWEAPAAGGTVLDQWPHIAPELQGKVTAAGFDAALGRLDLRPVSPAYATQLRLMGRQMLQRINTHLGSEAVRSLRVLPPGAQSSVSTGGSGPQRGPVTEVEGPVKTRADACPGYQDALAACQQHKSPPRTADPRTRAAIARHNELLREHREPEAQFADARNALEEERARHTVETDPHARALQRARAERGGTVTRLFSP